MSPKQCYSLTETCRRLKVKPHILRYWEKEFELGFKRNSAGRRIVSAEQLEQLELIKHLLHDEKLTVKGARKRLAEMRSAVRQGTKVRIPAESLLWLKKELVALRSLLESEP